MRRMLHALTCSVVVASAAVAAQSRPATPPGAAPTVKARAEITGERIAALASLTEEKNGSGTSVAIRIMAKGLPPGKHAVHLHAVGTCTPDFTAAGGHFDPGPKGDPDPDANHPYHMGDLPQLDIPASGGGTYEMRTTRVTLSDGPLSVFDADGTAIVVHANADQGMTGPSGSGVSGGPRIACGVIVKE